MKDAALSGTKTMLKLSASLVESTPQREASWMIQSIPSTLASQASTIGKMKPWTYFYLSSSVGRDNSLAPMAHI